MSRVTRIVPRSTVVDPLSVLADPEVRYEARRLLRRGVPAELVAAEIGVTAADLEWALRPVRRRTR